MAKKNLTRFFNNSGLRSACMKNSLVLTLAFLLTLAGCGGGSSNANGGKPPIDPSGNWAMKFSDSGNNTLLMSALFSQVGSVVSGVNISAFGNPAPFSCVPFSGSFANGEVLNVNQFSGDINTPSFGNIHFSSTLNDAGTHASGTYTLSGTCWTVASTGTFTADEVPSVAGAWSGTIACISNCPAGATTGTIAATLTQSDQTGVVTGSYSVTGLPNIGGGTITTRQGTDILSGQFIQVAVTDNTGNFYVLAGGPGDADPGLGLDRSFNGQLFEQKDHDPNQLNLATYTVTMSH
jgi:hypothetical protein